MAARPPQRIAGNLDGARVTRVGYQFRVAMTPARPSRTKRNEILDHWGPAPAKSAPPFADATSALVASSTSAYDGTFIVHGAEGEARSTYDNDKRHRQLVPLFPSGPFGLGLRPPCHGACLSPPLARRHDAGEGQAGKPSDSIKHKASLCSAYLISTARRPRTPHTVHTQLLQFSARCSTAHTA